MAAPVSRPGHVAVVGAGMPGLATAWFLQERGVRVTVLERERVAAGSSWGNAGWISPALTTPLPEPAVLRYGVRAALNPASPVYIPPRADARLLRFLLGFARHCTERNWRVAMSAYAPVNRRALGAFDALAAGGVDEPVREAEPFLACHVSAEDQKVLLEELRHVEAAGQRVEYEALTGAEARELEPALSEKVGAAVRIHGQRFINPGRYLWALAGAVRTRGGDLREGISVREVRDEGARVAVEAASGEVLGFDAVVLANGAWLNWLARRFGVRAVVQAGRGYSFSVPVEHMPSGPLYFPAQRVACTPLGDRLRIAGMMEFRAPEEPLDPRRIAAIVAAVRPLLRGIALEERTEEWVGSRPCTADGLPLIGPTASPRVFVAGGHGMWGIALGPLTGELLAETVATGRAPAELTPFHPLR
ncbi:FAD-dependent oxidoreductase [Rubrobacter taiwanensis]|jgi:D-amino-acid dehydrogenase|uniref:FAD-dependent oxidoreductase n=1 Tax=Rubrobacter taiwanensis TaxID=185139 RepID=A0A4R1BG74_9ACTN|nr:FAD-dependent oxidoreductase [Rubrobacter taiwanensis]TCJ16215.1 FAD-dependent oxidoreductase [Rubrobacter taiwanensis]